MNEDYNQKQNQNIILEGRKKINISGVIDVECFDDNSITLLTQNGILVVRGNEIKIEKLNLELGEVIATGDFYLMEYTSDENTKSGFFSKMFK